MLGLTGILLAGCGVLPSALDLSGTLKSEVSEEKAEVVEVEVEKDYLLVIKGGKVVDEKISKSIIKDGEISNTYKYIYELPEELTDGNLLGEAGNDSAEEVAYKTEVAKESERASKKELEDTDVWITFTVPTGYQVYLIPNVLEAQYSNIKNELLAQTGQLTKTEDVSNEVEGPVTSTVEDYE